MSAPTVNYVDISVVVVTYNRDQALCETLRSLVIQSPAAREIIVVDQSSKHDDATKTFLNKLICTKAIRYIFQVEPNAQRARNRAIEEARGEVVLFVDDDVTADPDLVDKHWQNYVDEELMAVCGFYTEPGESPVDLISSDCDDPLTGWIYFPHCFTKRVECHLLPTCNGSVRRRVAIAVGGFDENYTFTQFDDTDFACRMKRLGGKAVHDPLAKLVHHKEVRGGKRPGGINEYVIADSNRWYVWFYFFWMNFGWRGWPEIRRRLRGCVFRGKNIIRPWYLLIAMGHMIAGGWRAVAAIRHGRRLAFQATTIERQLFSPSFVSQPSPAKFGTAPYSKEQQRSDCLGQE
jgi:GT2 family glycosyltransferase